MQKKGLKILRKQLQLDAWKSKIQDWFQSTEEHYGERRGMQWLNDEGNPIDDSEERVIDLVENASDYDQDFCEMDKNVVQKLKTLQQSRSNRR